MLLKIDNKRDLIEKYPSLHKDFIRYNALENILRQEVIKSGMQMAAFSSEKEERKKIILQKLERCNVISRNKGRSLYVNYISPACLDCTTGEYSQTYFYTLKCNYNCYFCSNRNQMNYDEHVMHINNALEELKLTANHRTLKSVALTGGEPLLFPEKCYDFFSYTKKHIPLAHTRLYTNGSFLDEKVLERLKISGLNELRVSVKLDDALQYNNDIIEKVRLAVQYIPAVMIEMPVIPGSLDNMKELLLDLEKYGIKGINILEFLYPWHSSEEYIKRGFSIKATPYNVIYGYEYAGGLPVEGSELECLDLLLFALERELSLGVHYCSLENKLLSQIYFQNRSSELLPHEYMSVNDFFIKTAKVYDQEVSRAKKILGEHKHNDYIENEELGYIEFHPKYVKLIPRGVPVGISYNIVEFDPDSGESYMRELKIDLTYPEMFCFEEDI